MNRKRYVCVFDRLKKVQKGTEKLFTDERKEEKNNGGGIERLVI